jgi:ribosomal subunit interface protein
MKVQIQGKQMKVSDRLKRYVAGHLVRPLTRFYDNEAAELRVEFGDARPGKRGPDIECHLTLHMPGARRLQIEETTKSPYTSLDAATDRLVRVAKKELERMRDPGGHHTAHPLSRAVAEGGAPGGMVEDLPNVLK